MVSKGLHCNHIARLHSQVITGQYQLTNGLTTLQSEYKGPNEKLVRFGITQSPLCTFCEKEDESIEHLLFSCKESCEFWKYVLSWLRYNDINAGELNKLI